jgi:hypothetical protein
MAAHKATAAATDNVRHIMFHQYASAAAVSGFWICQA